MTTKTKLIIGGSVVALIGGYFIYKALRPKKPLLKVKADEEKPPIKDETKPDNSRPSNTKKYIVTASALNLRKEPNQNSLKVGKLNKGCVVEASPSSTSGWMDISPNFISTDKCFYDPSLFGEKMFGSSQYLKEVK